ncbi:MAG: RNA 3'-phosphate cyclase [Candidatus Diapherotrites archaeon]|nr:RNA 3'-phosphate cyclase [Candidatus Diapherotrites archaeon]
MIEVDGRAGGQVLRNALGFSALLGKGVRVSNIRVERKNPGLAKQHLAGLNFLSTATKAKVKGARVGSRDVTFEPLEFGGGSFVLKIGSAGSICLVIQSALLPSMLKKTRLRVFGGTDVPFAPPANYFSHVLFPLLRKMNAGFGLEVPSRGYFPKGGGSLIFSSRETRRLKPVDLSKRGALRELLVFSHSRGLPSEVSKNMAGSARKKLEYLGPEAEIVFDSHDSTQTTGCGVEIVGVYENSVLGASELGKKGVPAEKIGAMAAEKFLAEHNANAGVDIHASDQLISFMSLAKGKSVFSCRLLTPHLLYSIEVAKAFTGVDFKIQEKGGLFFVSCTGNGFFG